MNEEDFQKLEKGVREAGNIIRRQLKHLVEFDYVPGDEVVLVALDLPGVVRAIQLTGNQRKYWVTWWADGENCNDWLFPDEIRLK